MFSCQYQLQRQIENTKRDGYYRVILERQEYISFAMASGLYVQNYKSPGKMVKNVNLMIYRYNCNTCSVKTLARRLLLGMIDVDFRFGKLQSLKCVVEGPLSSSKLSFVKWIQKQLSDRSRGCFLRKRNVTRPCAHLRALKLDTKSFTAVKRV